MLCLMLAAPPVPAAGYGAGAGAGYGGSSNKPGLNNATTNRLVRFLKKGIRQCRALDSVYRYDCYRQNYSAAAGHLAAKPAYAVPLAALRDVERSLERILARNGDPDTPALRKGGAVFRAVRPESTKRAKEVFRQALDQAATKLLRSAEGAGTHFARIAKALDSNKILLRAMLRNFTRTLSHYMFG